MRFSNMDDLMNLYRDQPVKVERKKISLYQGKQASFFKQKMLERESKQKVEKAVNQWLYNELFRVGVEKAVNQWLYNELFTVRDESLGG